MSESIAWLNKCRSKYSKTENDPYIRPLLLYEVYVTGTVPYMLLALFFNIQIYVMLYQIIQIWSNWR